jgi:putative membrane protein
MNNYGMGAGMWFFWIVVIVFVVFVIKTMMDNNHSQHGKIKENPVDLLKKRYARGEIDKDEFESMKKELEK